MNADPILEVDGLTKRFDRMIACRDISFTLHRGEVLGIVGESGSGKSTLLRCLAGLMAPEAGRVIVDLPGLGATDQRAMDEAQREQVLPAALSLVHQNPRDGLRLDISAGGNIAEPLMAAGARNYAALRAAALAWLDRVEIGVDRIDDLPRAFSGGMQ